MCILILCLLVICIFAADEDRQFPLENPNLSCSKYNDIKRKEYFLGSFSNPWLQLPDNCPCEFKCHWFYSDEYEKVRERAGPDATFDGIVVFRTPHVIKNGLVKRQFLEEIAVFWEMEPPEQAMYDGHYENYAKADDPKYWGFNWKSTFQLDSELPITYNENSYSKGFNAFPDVKKSDEYFALFLVSNCVPEPRKEYMQELSKYIPISSMGKCLNNMQKPPEEIFPECQIDSSKIKNVTCQNLSFI